MAALALGSIALAQDQPQFKSESELVVLHVMVTDRSGSQYVWPCGQRVSCVSLVDTDVRRRLSVFL